MRVTSPISVDLLIVPGCSLMTAASSVEPLRAANRQAGRTVFDWRLVSFDGAAPVTSSGIGLPVSGRHLPSSRCDILVIVAGYGAAQMTDRKLVAHLYKTARQATVVIGIESGAWLLARTGLLDDHRAATHWEDFEEFAAAFPNVDLRPDRYVVDGRFLTTSGASPTFDLMVDVVRQVLGHPAALDVASSFVHDDLRAAGDAQVNVTLGDANHDPRDWSVRSGSWKPTSIHQSASQQLRSGCRCQRAAWSSCSPGSWGRRRAPISCRSDWLRHGVWST
jgi:transcriptional regulator GlxA family with amidase domain